MPYIRPAVQNAQSLLIKQIAAETAALVSSEGARILSLAQGTPNLPLFAPAVEAMTAAVQSALPYTDVNGLASVRGTAAEFVRAYYPLPSHAEAIGADHVLITTGAAQAVYNCLAISVGGPTDVVLSPLPAYGLYLHQTNVLGGTFDTVATSPEHDFKPTVSNLEQAFQKHTDTDENGKAVCRVRSLVLCFPNNPLGSVLSAEEAREIAEYLDAKLAAHPEADFSVVLDEVYLGLHESGAHHSILSYASPRLLANCLLILSVSKGLGAMPGARAGFLTCFSRELARELAKVQAACTANCCSIAQVGLAASLRHILDQPQAIRDAFAYYRARTDFCVRRLNEIGAKYFGAPVARPSPGTFYVMASFAGWKSLADDRAIQQFLRDQYRLNTKRRVGVACVPGCAFNLDPALKLIRFSCAVEMDVLEQAMDIVEEAVASNTDEFAQRTVA